MEFTMARYFFVLALLLVLAVPCGSWLWSRRRCGRVNCQWGAWSAWEPCNHPCGNAGEQSRSRRISRNPSCGGSPCRGPTSETQACNRFCYNGGTPQPGYCDFPDEFWGRCSEKPCTPIENCRHLVCTDGTNHQCRNCMYSYTPDIKAFRQVAAEGYINRICERLCSWRPDSRYCYPGACPDVPGSCRCAPGFEGPSNNCMTITRSPSITHCLGKLKKITGGSVEDFRDIECNHQTLRMYTNIKATQLEMDWQSTFTGPSMSVYPQPYYVSDFAVGVIQARVPWTLHRAGGGEESGYIECSEGYSRTNPNRNLHHCLKHVNFNRPLNHGDRLIMSPQVQNGGYLRLNNYDGGISPEVGPHKFYSGLNTSHTATLLFDFTSPSHCSVGARCSRKFLELGKPYRKEAKVNAVYEGWTDLPSGIKKYELEVFKMKPYGNVLGPELHPFVKVDTLPGNTSCSVNLPAPGMYCFVLAVDDNAGNHRYSRAFVLFDNVHAVKVSPHGNTAIRVTSAAANTSYTWITNLSQQVRVAWKGHFMNQFHHEHKLLAAIRPHSPAIDEGYEVRRGQPPGVRSVEAIPNAYGVTAFHIQYDVDKNGGVNNTNPRGTWAAVPNVQSEAASLRIPRVDGDSIRVFIKATDVMGHEVSDNTLVKVDSTPPEVTILGLNKDGHRGLAVHKSTELFDMALELETYDDHSGVFSIAWVLHDFADQSKVHGQGHLAVVRKKPGGPCEPPSCACVPATQMCYQRNYTLKPDPSKMTRPEGSHDHDYMYTITVANNAKLVTIKTFKVTVDTSPPHTGEVKDSVPGSPDVDFQSHMTQHASWAGFFDKESGVMFYQYGFSDRCLTPDDFAPSSTNVHRTTNTWASRSVSKPGKYHVTVVAYNHALDTSTPVCSDGVTVDVTPPALSAVSVEGLFVHESLVADPITKDVYHLSRDRVLTLLTNTSADCRWNATEVNITSYVIRRHENGTLKTTYLPPETCATFTRFVRSEYLQSEHKLRFSWFGEDGESGISDYETGLSATGRGEPDLQPFRSTHNHRHYHTYHSGLSHGQEFYIHIKAVNKAGLSSHMVTRPVVIEAWAPSDLVRKLEMSYRRTDDGNDVIVTWEQTADKSLVQSLKTAYLTIVDMKSKIRVMETRQVYKKIKSSQSEVNIVIPGASLTHHLHPQHTYQVVMRTETVAGHLHDYLSHVYTHDHGPPSAGQVWHTRTDGQVYKCCNMCYNCCWGPIYKPNSDRRKTHAHRAMNTSIHLQDNRAELPLLIYLRYRRFQD